MRPRETEPRRSAPARRRTAGERGQSTVEYVLLLALMSIPISIMVLKFLQMVIRIVVTAIVGDFTEGHI